MTQTGIDRERFQRSDRVPFRDLGTALLIGDAQGSSQVLLLPEQARLLWDALIDPRSIADLAGILQDQTGLVDAPERASEVVELLDQLGAVIRA
jgi:hypothetical protein